MRNTQLLPRLAVLAGISIIVIAILSFMGNNPLHSLIPKGMPEVASVKTYYEPESLCTLIHLRQIHSVSRVEPTVEGKNQLDRVQREIYTIALSLKTNAGLQDFYAEGVTEANLPEIMMSIERRKEVDAFAKQAGEFHKVAKEIGALAHMLEAGLGRTSRPPARLEVTNAAPEKSDEGLTYIKLVVEGGMTLRPAESEETEVRSARAIQTAFTDVLTKKDLSAIERIKDDPRVTVDRENELLRLLAKDHANGVLTNGTALAIYGGLHDFEKRVRNWNKTNHLKFSLITVTPRSY
ncbi:MAG: hypothetical protein Q7R93_01785 [bacterium]|nr:hypothetical protein [bacterium]